MSIATKTVAGGAAAGLALALGAAARAGDVGEAPTVVTQGKSAGKGLSRQGGGDRVSAAT